MELNLVYLWRQMQPGSDVLEDAQLCYQCAQEYIHKKDWPLAVQKLRSHLRRALELDPENQLAWKYARRMNLSINTAPITRSDILFQQFQLNLQIKENQPNSQEITTATQCYQRARECIAIEAWDEVVRELEKAIQLIPDCNEYYVLLAKAYFCQEIPEQAEACSLPMREYGSLAGPGETGAVVFPLNCHFPQRPAKFCFKAHPSTPGKSVSHRHPVFPKNTGCLWEANIRRSLL